MDCRRLSKTPWLLSLRGTAGVSTRLGSVRCGESEQGSGKKENGSDRPPTEATGENKFG